MLDNIVFVKSVYELDQIPGEKLPQLILCGRSNVGKSSFINSLFGKKSLAKTSSTPGKTRSINFYLVDENFYIVDLPGYGYAKTSRQEREKWGKLISEYLKSNRSIVHALHIIDSRHNPTELDLLLNELLISSKIPYTFLMNKADKLTQSGYANKLKHITDTFPEAALNDNLFFYSSVKMKWRRTLLIWLRDLFYGK